MEKESYYFPHFTTARHDRKIKRVRKELGLEGYGIFFMLLEVLREQTDFSYPIEDIDLLADEFGTSEQKIKTVIYNYQLFEVDDQQKFFSPKMLLYLEPYFKMKNQRIEAAIKRWGMENDSKKLCDRIAPEMQSKVKKSKVKESKVYKDEKIRIAWERWIDYKKKQFNEKYKDESSEQIAINKLTELCKNNYDLAEHIVNQSITGLWRGLFELKNTLILQPKEMITSKPQKDFIDFEKLDREGKLEQYMIDHPDEFG